MKLDMDVTAAMKKLEQLQKRDIPKVIGRSLTRTGSSTKSRVSRLMRERVNLKKSVVDASLKMRRSAEIQSLAALRAGRSWFEVRVKGTPIPLRDFAARQTARGVTFKVAKRGQRKLYQRQMRKGFVVDKLGQHTFVRTGPNPPGPRGAPIKKVYGPSLPQFFSTKKLQRAAILHAQETWAKELTANLKNMLRGYRA